MNRHLKKIPESFDGRDGADGATDGQRDAEGAGIESADGAGAESAAADTPEHPVEPDG